MYGFFKRSLLGRGSDGRAGVARSPGRHRPNVRDALGRWAAESGSWSFGVESRQLLSHARGGIPKRSDGMRGDEILMLGIGIQPPW